MSFQSTSLRPRTPRALSTSGFVTRSRTVRISSTPVEAASSIKLRSLGPSEKRAFAWVWTFTLTNLPPRYHNAVLLTVKGADAAVTEALGGIPGVDQVEAEGEGRFVLFPKDGAAIVERVSERVRERGLEVTELHVEAGRLDEVFRAITTAAQSPGAGGRR